MGENVEQVQPKDASLAAALQGIASGDVMQVAKVIKEVSADLRTVVSDDAAKVFLENFVVGTIRMRKAATDKPWTLVDANGLKTNLVDMGVLKMDQMPSFPERIKAIFS